MAGKKITIGAITILITIIVASFIYLLQIERFDQKSTIKAIPNSAAVIIKINQPLQFYNYPADNSQLNHNLLNFDSYKEIKEITEYLNRSPLLNPENSDYKIFHKPYTVSLHPKNKQEISWLITKSIKNRGEYNEIKKIAERAVKLSPKSEKKDNSITEIKESKEIPFSIYTSIEDGFLLVSNSPELLKESLTLKESKSIIKETLFNEIERTTSSSNVATLYFNYKNLNSLTDPLFYNPSISNISRWSGLDLSLRDDAIILNGFSKGDNGSHFTEVLKNLSPQRSTISTIIPSNSRFIMRYNIKPKEQFKNNLLSFIKNSSENNYTPLSEQFNSKTSKYYEEQFFSFLGTELAFIYNEAEENSYNPLLIFETTGQNKTLEIFKTIAQSANETLTPAKHSLLDDETEIPVYKTPQPEIMTNLWEPILPEVPNHYFTFYQNYIIFAQNEEALTSYIYSNILNQTIDNTPYYSEFEENFSYADNFFLFTDIPHIESIAGDKLNREIFNPTQEQKEILFNFYGAGAQMSTTGNMIYTTIYANHTPDRDKEPSTVWQSRLDSTVGIKPAIVTNHNTGENEILVQDNKNNLYLLNRMGRILWKRSLSGRIKSEIYQIDYYKNSKLQYLFNTKDRIYLLDRNGNHVARYPVSLPAQATNGIALFDYNDNKEYRIFIALEDQRIYLFDKTGNRIPGWEITQTEGRVTQPIQHFRNLGRDYIVFSDNFKNYILNRRGETRVRSEINFSRNSNTPFYLERENSNQSALVTTTTNGELAKISLPSGKTTVEPLLDSPKKHSMKLIPSQGSAPQYLITKPYSILLLDSELSKITTIEFENEIIPFSDIYRFSANDIKFGAVEKEEGNIHLINKNGTFYQGFPLRGNSRFSIGILSESSRRFNLITGGDYNYLYNYRID
ncbi:DUF3352 domain-containing protein [Marinilabiliaceae bacterium ANBcel2]|nr:DUF3352 domain-containing protein [Marinilabiliaceae bacterium ANBcel2]